MIDTTCIAFNKVKRCGFHVVAHRASICPILVCLMCSSHPKETSLKEASTPSHGRDQHEAPSKGMRTTVLAYIRTPYAPTPSPNLFCKRPTVHLYAPLSSANNLEYLLVSHVGTPRWRFLLHLSAWCALFVATHACKFCGERACGASLDKQHC